MPNSALAKDSLFQLNTLVWASFPQPINAPVTPVLKNIGYILWAIEKPLDANIAELARLTKATSEIRPNPVVDVVLYHDKKRTYILMECKPTSFSIYSDWTPQARGIIVAGGNVSSRLGVSGKPSSEVCYLVPAGDAQSTDATLESLREGVSNQGFAVCPTGTLGLSIKSDGAYLGSSNQPKGKAKMPLELTPEQRVISVNADQDPRPLYVIPWIPDVQDDADLEAFKEKLRAQLLSWLGKAAIPSKIIFMFEEILDEVSRGVFRYWSDKSSLFGRVLPTVEKLVRIFFGDDTRVSVGRRDVTVDFKVEKDREELMERVRTTALPQKLPEGIQLPLE
jgi:hypothetical protein